MSVIFTGTNRRSDTMYFYMHNCPGSHNNFYKLFAGPKFFGAPTRLCCSHCCASKTPVGVLARFICTEIFLNLTKMSSIGWLNTSSVPDISIIASGTSGKIVFFNISTWLRSCHLWSKTIIFPITRQGDWNRYNSHI